MWSPVAVVVLALAVIAAPAHADQPALVNLLTAAPSLIAVSSTVDNPKIRPEHIADGKLETAWNSATGQIIGAWVEVRVVAGARIKQIKLTAGFAAVDKRLGDRFTKNARIKTVRLYHAGRPIKDVTLDPANRALQTVHVDLAGGDLRIEVTAAEPGSIKSWREACISELEVWGTLPAATAAAAKPVPPSVRLGSLDALPVLSKADCRAAILTAANRLEGSKITVDQQLAVSGEISICRFDRAVADSLDVTVDFAAVRRRTRAVLGSIVTETIQRGEDPPDPDTDMEPMVHADRVALRLLPLTTTESALLEEVITVRHAWDADGGATKATLYRITAKGLVNIARWGSDHDSEMEGGSSDRCELIPPVQSVRLPRRLELACTSTKEDWHNEDVDKRGMNEQSRTVFLKWDGTRFQAP